MIIITRRLLEDHSDPDDDAEAEQGVPERVQGPERVPAGLHFVRSPEGPGDGARDGHPEEHAGGVEEVPRGALPAAPVHGAERHADQAHLLIHEATPGP